MDDNMKAIMAVAKSRRPVMLVGAPGTGKTQTIKAMARELGYDLITLVGSRMDPTDISGLPAAGTHINPDTMREYLVNPTTGEEDPNGEPFRVTAYHPQWWQAEIMRKRKVILFFDEFSNTPPSVRASLLTLLQDREFPNGEVMPKETIVMGAMNPVTQAADGSDLDLPTKNRMFFIPWRPTAESWYKGMLNAWGNKVSDNEMYYRKMIVNFIKKNPYLLHKEPSDGMSDDGSSMYGANTNDPSEYEVFYSAWPSRRTWDNLSVALGAAPKSDNVQDIIARGTVGYEAATEFREFLKQQMTYDPREVLDDPTIFDWENAEPSELSIVIRGIDSIKKPEDYLKVVDFFIMIAEQGRASEGASYITPTIQYASSAASNDPKNRELFTKKTTKLFEVYHGVGKASSKQD